MITTEDIPNWLKNWPLERPNLVMDCCTWRVVYPSAYRLGPKLAPKGDDPVNFYPSFLVH